VTYEGWTTMSKSKNNGVDPQDLIEKYGADTARLYTMFTAPPEATLEWNDAALEGSYRFLRRIWNFALKLGPAAAAPAAASGKLAQALRREIHMVLRQVDYDYQRMQYNTVVSGAMKMLNALEDFKGNGEPGAGRRAARGLRDPAARAVPGTPHVTHALWKELGYAAALGDLLDAPWPQVDEAR
jgi:leucyl-tRNA synthetase